MSERPAGISQNWVSRQCDHCGQDVWRAPSDFNGAQTFCSIQCRADNQGAAKKRNRVESVCRQCGERFYRAPSQANRPFCSLTCYHDSLRKPKHPDAEDANVPTPRTKAPPWPVVRLPEDDPRERIRARFRAVRAQYQEATA